MIVFWILAPIMVLAALGLLFVRKAVHCALLLAVVMIGLAVLYAAQDAPFLFAVQIIVYTGAILMLFLFVLMLVGVDSSDSVVETIRGQRLFAAIVGLLFGVTLVISLAQVTVKVTGLDNANAVGQRAGDREDPLHHLRLRLRGHLGPADHGSARRDGARAPRAARPEGDAAPTSPRAGCATTPSTASTSARCPHPACSPGTTRSTPRPCCPTARPPTRRSRGCSPPAARSTRPPAAPPRWSSSAAATRACLPVTTQDRRVDESRHRSSLLSAILFTIGAVGVLVRRNAIVVFMCVELMLNASNLALITFSRINGNLDGQIAAFFVMVVAAAEVVVGLAIIMTIFRTRRSASVDDASLLKY